MTYEQTISWLYSLEGKLGMDFRLERLGPVLDRLEHPESSFLALHVGGTNGKGSTSAMAHAILRSAGYAAGLYTSPHLHSFRERIRVGDRLISREAVVRHVAAIRSAAAASAVELTYFEITTIAAFLEFRERELPIAVVEVGLGGRLDATNVVCSVGVAITSIGLDHCSYLGDSLEAVAAEKSGIIKAGVPTVTGPLLPEALGVVEGRTSALGSPLMVCGRDFQPEAAEGVSLRGNHQLENAAVARALIGAVEPVLHVSAADIAAGLKDVRWPGRFEMLSADPMVIVDGAHNPQAAVALAQALEDAQAPTPRILVFGVMADKDWRAMLDVLAVGFDHIVAVPVDQARALDPQQTHDFLSPDRSCSVAASVAEGLNEARARAGRAGSVVVTGSIFLVGEAYQPNGGSPENSDAPIHR